MIRATTCGDQLMPLFCLPASATDRLKHGGKDQDRADEYSWLAELPKLLWRFSALGIGADTNTMNLAELKAVYRFLRRRADAEDATASVAADFSQRVPPPGTPAVHHLEAQRTNYFYGGSMLYYDPNDVPALFPGLPNRPKEVVRTYGGHEFCNPEDSCRKILEWFVIQPVLSDEQAIHDLHIPNFRDRISDLRKRGYRIHSMRILYDIAPRRLFHGMVYALHRDIPSHEDIPGYWRSDEAAWIARTKVLLARYFGIADFALESMTDMDHSILDNMLNKMQCK